MSHRRSKFATIIISGTIALAILFWFAGPLLRELWPLGDSELMAAPTAPINTTLSADADAQVNSVNTSNNYGTLTTMQVGKYSGTVYRSYVHFNLSSIPDGAIIQQATLRLHVYTTYGGSDYVVEIHRPQASWTETGISWSTQPSWIPSGITTTVTSSASHFDWDVTALAQNWLGGTNYGLMLRATNESFDSAHEFYAREGAQPPQLLISYTLPNLVVDLFGYNGSPIVRNVPIGDQIDLRVQNDGQAPVPDVYYSIGFYISPDATITTGDTLLTGGRSTGPILAASDTITVAATSSARVPASYPTGPAYLGVLLDEFNVIDEENEGDNTAALSVFVLPAEPYTWTVNTTGDDLSHVTLRYALTHARAGDRIHFDPAVFPPGAPATIALGSGLPAVTQGNLVIDGSGAGVIIDGSAMITGTGLVLSSDNNMVSGLQIRDMPGNGISILGNGNVIGGGGSAPRLAARTTTFGVAGPPAQPDNVISGNGDHGISIQGNSNIVQGNYIGTNAAGTAADANGRNGIEIRSGAQNNIIGGDLAGEGNLVSGNTFAGIEILNENSTGNRIEGNYVGTNVSGGAAIANNADGVEIHSDANHNRVGGTGVDSGNLIAGNIGIGIYIGGTDHITVTGNLIGTNITGTAALANSSGGISIYESSDNLIGGAPTSSSGCPSPCNLVSGNGSSGISIRGIKAQGNRVLGNLIGVNRIGDAAIANGNNGVLIWDGAHDNQVGDTGSGEGNTISGNLASGVALNGTGVQNNLVVGNIIGLNAAGTSTIANLYGIRLENGPQQNRIGGPAAGEPNTIAGNALHGVHIFGSGTGFNQVQRNFIGTNSSGSGYLGNGGPGVSITGGAHDNVIGIASGSGNVIVSNTGAGVDISAAVKNTVVNNYIGQLANGTVRANQSHGVSITGASTENAVTENVIASNTGDGIRVDGSGSLGNTLSRNSIYNNGGAGIENVNGGNAELPPPTWFGQRNAANRWTFTGTTCANCAVEIFSDSSTQGRFFEASGYADGSGAFNISNVTRKGQMFRLTTTDVDGNTSEFGDTLLNIVPDATGSLEVTQSIQDRNNSVILIENKPTFVRFHVHAENGTGTASARLSGWRGATFLGNVLPGNPGAEIDVLADPDRGQIDDSFWFRLPSSWLTGTLTLIAEANYDGRMAESNRADNYGNDIVTFEYSPPMNLLMVDACYVQNGTTYTVSATHYSMLASWLRRAYPINRLNWRRSTFITCYNGLPASGQVNADLLWNKTLNIIRNGDDPWMRYYGMVDDGGGFARGLALDIPSTVATGPAGASCCGGWDTDGSYNDWYGAHELGHTYGLSHTQGTQPPPAPCGNGCGCEAVSQFVYPNGDISPTQDEDAANALYGFDIADRSVYPPTWKDVMTYCPNEWVSDLSYEDIHAQMIGEKPEGAARSMVLQTTGEYLAVFGTIVTATNQVTLQHFYRVPDAWGAVERITGTYSIRLLDSGGSTLADYPFSLRSIMDEPGPGCSTAEEPQEATIAEFVPWVSDTAQVSIYDGTTELVSRTVSINTPVVAVISPNGGENLNGPTATISWSASDDDGDDLLFTVQYSADGGAHWRVLQPNTSESSLVISIDLLAGTTQGRIRVIASDGVNTAQDDSNGDFNVPLKAPQLQHIAPLGTSVYVYGQTVGFQADAQDAEDDPLADTAFVWTSSISGTLGAGRYLALADLITGTHIITITVTDSDGLQDYSTATVIIGESGERVFLPLVLRNSY